MTAAVDFTDGRFCVTSRADVTEATFVVFPRAPEATDLAIAFEILPDETVEGLGAGFFVLLFGSESSPLSWPLSSLDIIIATCLSELGLLIFCATPLRLGVGSLVCF